MSVPNELGSVPDKFHRILSEGGVPSTHKWKHIWDSSIAETSKRLLKIW